MSSPPKTSTAERRARRMIALYPPDRRRRYAEEFTALMIDEIEERPHVPRRTLNVVRCAIREQLAAHGARRTAQPATEPPRWPACASPPRSRRSRALRSCRWP